MNKTLRLCLLATWALFAACTEKEQPIPNPEPSSSEKDEVKVTSGDSATVSSDGGEIIVQFTSSGKWSASLSNDRAASWLSLSATDGAKGSASITLTASRNEEPDDRSATIRITCGKASASITITQKQKDALTNTPSKTQIGAEGGSFTIEVKANIDYSFEIDVDWIHQASTKALVSKETAFTVDKNEDTRKREGSVTVKSALGSERITIYQEAGAPSIILSSESVSIGTQGGIFTVDVNTNVDVEMAITAGAEWLSEVTTKAMSTHSYTFKAAPNEGTDSREGKITFKNEQSGLEATVTVTQMQKDAFVVSQPLYEIGAAGGVVSIEASTNVDLDVRISEPWVHQIKTKAMNTVSYDFQVDANSGYDVRECTVTFSGGEEISVFSDPSPWSIIGTMNGDNWTRDIEMKTDGKWHVVRGVSFTASDEFKFRKNKDWGENFGSSSNPGPTLPANVKVFLTPGGGNFKMVAGTYDFYLSPENKMAYVLTAGTPFAFEGYNDTPQRLSQTVTIRQDGVDGFLPDFKDQYTVSSKQQVLELRSRSSVEVQAESKCDWISIVKTKALADSNISLQIAENTSSSSRTGEVVVNVPALGESRTVTITQKAAGEMYIPDSAFYAWLLSRFDENGDGGLSQEECNKVTLMEWALNETPGIKSLKGLEYFPNLEYLRLKWEAQGGGADIEEIDLSGNPKLKQLSLNSLPKLKGLTIDAPNLSDIYIRGCPALKGMDDFSRFKNLSNLSLSDCPWLTELDCSFHKNLYYLSVESCDALTKIVVSSLKLHNLYIGYCKSLPYSGITLPQETFDLAYLNIDTIASIPEEFDYSMCPGLKQISISSVADYWSIKTIWLMTGITPPDLYGFARNAEIKYKGENLLVPIEFESSAFLDLILKNNQYYDVNQDGGLSAYELSQINYLVVFSDWFTLEETITTLEDIGHLTNLEHFGLHGFGNKVTAPIPESLKTLTKLESFSLEDCRIQGTLPEWIADMPSLTELSLFNCYPLGGPIPGKLLLSETLTYLEIRGCAFTGCTIVVPKDSFLDYDSKYYHPNGYFRLTPQREMVQRETQDGGDYVYDLPNILYKSDADGTGAVHPNGEVVLYHAATKGPGLDLIITGDGFSAENNTVGGTMEAYLTACAEQFLHQEPYDKLADYYNVWLVYAHSRTEGTGVQSDRCTIFGTRHTNPEKESTVTGNHGYIQEFVRSAIGRDCSNAVIAVIMNSSVYGGTCYWSYNSFDKWNYSIAYTPAAPGDLLPTFVHETLGHGIGKLGDEYSADNANPGSAPSNYPFWATVGIQANVDNVSDPAQIRWHNFLSDPRYADEGLGVFEGAYYANYGWYRPSENSVMRLQLAPGGDRFNAPSREAIYQRTMFWAGGEAVWSAYSDWASYIAGTYNYEEFVAFDKAPSPSPARAAMKKTRRGPRKVTLHDGRTIEQKLPPHTPPVIITR